MPQIAFTVALAGALIFSALNIVPFVTDSHETWGAILAGAVMPIGTMLLLSAIERCFPPAGPRKSLNSWLVNVQLNIAWLLLAGIVNAFALMGTNKLAQDAGIKSVLSPSITTRRRVFWA